MNMIQRVGKDWISCFLVEQKSSNGMYGGVVGSEMCIIARNYAVPLLGSLDSMKQTFKRLIPCLLCQSREDTHNDVRQAELH